MERLPITRLAVIAWVGIFGATPYCKAATDDWRLSASVVTNLTFTDNVNQAPPGQERSDLVFGVSTPLGLRRSTSRVTLNADYVPTIYLYAKTHENDELRHNLRSLLSAELVDDFFFIDATANIYQTYISPLQPRPVSGVSETDNLTQQTTLGLSPYIQRKTDRGWKYLLRNDNFWNTYSEAGLSDSMSSRVTVDVESPPSRLRYGFDYSYYYARDESQPVRYHEQIARVRPIVSLTRRFDVSGRLGYEAVEYFTDNSGVIYGAGVDWTPTPRTRLNGFLEHRYFGPSYGVTFDHRTRRTVWRLKGTRNTYTTLEQPLVLRPGTTAEVLDDAFRAKISDPVQREEAVRQFLQRAGLPPTLTQPYSFYTNQVYLSEQWTGSVGFVGRRNTIDLTLLWQQNEPITTEGSVLPGAVVSFESLRQQGATVTFTHRLSQVMTLALAGSRIYARTENFANTTDKSTEDTIRLSLTRQLDSQTDVSIGVRWVDFDSLDDPYEERAIFGAFAHRF